MRRPNDAEERLSPEAKSHWWGEHRSRYRFAARHARDRTVLDIACGPAYGSVMLLEAGASLVLAADISLDALRDARGVLDSFGGRAAICLADGAQLPLSSRSFGLVASFETLEHIEHDEEFIDEVARILTPDGVFVLSTPNALITRPVDGKPENPFHVREYDPAQLRALLGPRFSEVTLLGQNAPANYRFTPFIDRRGMTPWNRVFFFLWRVMHKMPFAMKERWARSLHGRSFYPGEDDWLFTEEDLEQAHVLVAVCRP